jgi:hypothetical protein
MGLLTVELEHGRSFEDDVQLLLPAHMFVVLSNKHLAGTTRHEQVDSERLDAEGVL